MIKFILVFTKVNSSSLIIINNHVKSMQIHMDISNIKFLRGHKGGSINEEKKD